MALGVRKNMKSDLAQLKSLVSTDQKVNPTNPSTASRSIVTDKAIRSMADSIFRQLQDEGCNPKDIISVSNQLLGLVTSELTKSDQE